MNKYAQYFVQYLKFKELVTVSPLVPDRQALEKIRLLEKEGEKQVHQTEEQEALFEEELNNLKEEMKEGEEQD